MSCCPTSTPISEALPLILSGVVGGILAIAGNLAITYCQARIERKRRKADRLREFESAVGALAFKLRNLSYVISLLPDDVSKANTQIEFYTELLGLGQFADVIFRDEVLDHLTRTDLLQLFRELHKFILTEGPESERVTKAAELFNAKLREIIDRVDIITR